MAFESFNIPQKVILVTIHGLHLVRIKMAKTVGKIMWEGGDETLFPLYVHSCVYELNCTIKYLEQIMLIFCITYGHLLHFNI